MIVLQVCFEWMVVFNRNVAQTSFKFQGNAFEFWIIWESSNWRNIWLTDWLFFFIVWEWHSAAWQEKTMLEMCNPTCENDGYFVTMSCGIHDIQTGLSGQPISQTALYCRLSYLNRMRAHELWNGRISQFTVTICACADKGYSDQDCEIAIDLKCWKSHHASHVMCTSCILACV